MVELAFQCETFALALLLEDVLNSRLWIMGRSACFAHARHSMSRLGRSIVPQHTERMGKVQSNVWAVGNQAKEFVCLQRSNYPRTGHGQGRASFVIHAAMPLQNFVDKVSLEFSLVLTCSLKLLAQENKGPGRLLEREQRNCCTVVKRGNEGKH